MENLEILSSFTTPDELVERILKEKNEDNGINSKIRKIKSYIEKIKSSMKISPFLIKKRKMLLVSILGAIGGALGIITIVFIRMDDDDVSLLIYVLIFSFILSSTVLVPIGIEKLRLKILSRTLKRCYQELQNKLEPLQNPSTELKKKLLEEYLKEEVKKKRDYYLSEQNPIYKADRELENKLLDTIKLFKEAKQLNEELAINRISLLLKKLKEQKKEIEKLKNNARNTIVKIENVVSIIINSYDKKYKVESLYQKIEDNEKDIENLGMEIDKTSAEYRAHAEVYLKEVMTCLVELAEYSLILNNLKPDTDDMDKIDIILSKQPFKKIDKKLS